MFISRLLCDYIWIMLHQLGLQTVCVCCCNQLRIYYITSIDVTLHALKHKASYSYIYAITYNFYTEKGVIWYGPVTQ